MGAGRGGEYVVQEGFGWTNGVVLDLLDKYGDRVASDDFDNGGSSAAGVKSASVAAVLLSLAVVKLG